MNLLLTSAGITNPEIAKALLELANHPADKIKLAFVPTAASLISDDKGWLIDNLVAFKDQGYESIDIVDIAAVPRENWLERFRNANVICFGGGNENYLAQVMQESGVAKELPELLKSRTYMGISAGSMVAGSFPPEGILELIYPEETFDRTNSATLEFVNLHFIPHLNSDFFQSVRKEKIETLSGFTAPVYALDDNCALKINSNGIEVVGGGEYLEFN